MAAERVPEPLITYGGQCVHVGLTYGGHINREIAYLAKTSALSTQPMMFPR